VREDAKIMNPEEPSDSSSDLLALTLW
jgi:hypothetical protein